MGMGVAGLLEALAVEAEEVVWPGKVRGAAIGIDISVWLHELATRHYQSVVLLKKYDDVVAAVEERARAYVMAGVKPVFVFDGRRLPGKTCTDQARAERRLAAQALIDAELDGTTDLTQLRAAISAGAELPISIECCRRCGRRATPTSRRPTRRTHSWPASIGWT